MILIHSVCPYSVSINCMEGSCKMQFKNIQFELSVWITDFLTSHMKKTYFDIISTPLGDIVFKLNVAMNPNMKINQKLQQKI